MSTSSRKILFLGETFRADAQTWMRGLRQHGGFEIVSWELKQPGRGVKKIFRYLEYVMALWQIRRCVRKHKPDMVIAERTTSYGFLAALSGVKPVAIAQQGITDIFPLHSFTASFKKAMQAFAFRQADLIHAWGSAMADSMKARQVNMQKVLQLPKGIDLGAFTYPANREFNTNRIRAVVTRSLSVDYHHHVIIKAFRLLKQRGMDVQLTIIGEGPLRDELSVLVKKLDLTNEVEFTGAVDNLLLPQYLHQCNFYVSMPITEGASASLLEAMACGLYPIVTDLPGNRAWIENGVNGSLVPVDDVAELAESFLWVCHHSDYAVQAVKRNRAMVEANADYDRNMQVIANRYHELIEHKLRSGHR